MKLAIRPFLAVLTVAVLGVGTAVVPVGPGVQEARAATNVGTGECAQTVGTPSNVTVSEVSSKHSITSGGTLTPSTTGDQTATTYCVLDFKGSSSWTAPQNISIEYFVVGGGEGGGGGYWFHVPRGGGGGGAGGITRGGIAPGSEFSVATGNVVTIVVGGGGVGGSNGGQGGVGESSSITFGMQSVVAGGGGQPGGAWRADETNAARGGTSGSGDFGSQAGGWGAERMWGRAGGGGGGVNAGKSPVDTSDTTTRGGTGGDSWRIRILGDSTLSYFAGGGGGGGPSSGTSGGGTGSGGGGAAFGSSQFNGFGGQPNTGGGGGGGSVKSDTKDLGTGGSGGSGRVIIRYTPPSLPTQLALTSSAPVTPQSEVKLSPAPVIQLRDSSNTLVTSASNAVTATIASGGPSGATLSGNVVNAVNGVATFSNLAITGPVGNYTLEFTSPDLATATSQSISLAKRAITVEGGSPSVNFGTLFTPTALYCEGSSCSQDFGSRTVDHAQTNYTYTGTQGTVYGPSLEKPVNAGRYHVEPFDLVITGALASDYDITYRPGILEIRKVSRTLAFTSPSSLTLQYGGTATVVAAPSVGDGAITYSVGLSTACSVNASSGVVTVTSASGTCLLSSTIAAGTNHLTAPTISSVTVTVSKRPITVAATPQSVTVGGVVSSSPTVTSGALQLSDTLSSATFTYEGTGSTTYSASTTAPTALGTYSVTPSVAVFGSGLAASYVISYAPGTLEIVAVPPPVVASGGGGAAPAPVVVAPVETPRGPRNPRALPVTPNTSPVGQVTQRSGARTDMNAPARATIGGRPANLVVTPSGPGGISLSAGSIQLGLSVNDSEGGISLSAGSIQLGLSVNDSEGGNVQMDTPSRSPELVVPRGKSAAVSGGGLFPGSYVQLWLPGNGNDSREIARIVVRADGTFSSEVTLEAGSLELPVPIGRQALAMVGFDEEGNETVIDMTINVSQGVPAPEMNRQTGELPGLSAGQSLATSAGMPETLSVTGIPDAGIVTMEGADWVISVSVGDSNGSAENAEGTVQLSMGQASGGSATGSGFLPGTVATVWFFSEPTLAATVTVDDNGEFSAEFLVDARFIAPGERTLQIQGVGTDGFLKAANLGVMVEQPVELTTQSASGLLWGVAGAFLLALLLIVSLLVRRSRHS